MQIEFLHPRAESDSGAIEKEQATRRQDDHAHVAAVGALANLHHALI
jgi:hypothetical protein